MAFSLSRASARRAKVADRTCNFHEGWLDAEHITTTPANNCLPSTDVVDAKDAPSPITLATRVSTSSTFDMDNDGAMCAESTGKNVAVFAGPLFRT